MSNFKIGEAVEVSKGNNDNWYYPASVVRPPCKNKKLVFVEYLTLWEPSSDSEPRPQKRLREYVNVAFVRPKLPFPDQLNPVPCFKVGDAVDAYRPSLSAWCPATVTDILENSTYLVAFRDSDSAPVHHCSLRLHRDWDSLRGNWVPPLPQHHQHVSIEKPPEMVTKPENLRFRIKYSRKPQKESRFKRGTVVEVRNDDEGYKGAWFVATVVDMIGKDKDRFVVEYRDLTTGDGTQLLIEEIDARFIRPCPPEAPFVGSFKQFQEVDAWYNDGWWEGVVLEVLNSRECFVRFMHSDVLKLENSELRPHQDWLDGKWVMSSKEKPPEMVNKPENLRFRIKYSRKPQKESRFKKGTMVEVSNDDEGYKGAWFVATVVDIIRKDKDRFVVEYRDLTTGDGTRLLIEETNARFIRPCPPEAPVVVSFKQFQEVDAWYNDGWWEGVVLEVLSSRECFVRFMHNDVLKFENSKLRPHQDWLDGKWVMSSKKSSELVKKFGDVMPKAKNLTGNKLVLKYQKPSEHAKKPTDVMTKTTNTRSKFVLHFCNGAKVEVRSDEEGYQGAWYTAIVVDSLKNGKYLVEYLTLKTDDLTEQLKEEADASDIRPYPPDINHIHRYVLRERVDAWYNDGWWVGQVSSVLHGFKYRVYFWPTKEELEFEHCHLRPHQEWIDGRWVLASLG